MDGAIAATITAVVLLLLLALLARAGRRRAASRKARRRAARALAGESAAELLLADAGWQIIDRQVRLTWSPWLDGEPRPTELRCDLLVEQDGERRVAEVKTGEAAPSLSTAATRRQLLEYQVAYGVDGVLLVDAEAGVIHAVNFPGAPARRDDDDDDEGVGADDAPAHPLTWLATGIAIGTAATAALTAWL